MDDDEHKVPSLENLSIRLVLLDRLKTKFTELGGKGFNEAEVQWANAADMNIINVSCLSPNWTMENQEAISVGARKEGGVWKIIPLLLYADPKDPNNVIIKRLEK